MITHSMAATKSSPASIYGLPSFYLALDAKHADMQTFQVFKIWKV
jgi:hypothetical protein